MAKPERGLPKTFDIKVPSGPVRLGDYLDEAPAVAPPPPPQPVAVAPAPVAAAPAPEPTIVTTPVPAPAAAPPPPAPSFPQAPMRSAPPRKQFNMSPETLRMLDELLAHIRLYSAERDVRASELVHALVLAVHEVRPFLDLTHVPQRGKWGSATAAALPLALKDAFQKAIARSASARRA